MRTLIAEDDRTSRMSLETIIGKWGYDVMTASDGVEAWSIIQKEQRELPLILLDMEMPGIDGLDACRKVRSFSDSRLPYVIFMSAKERKKIIAEGLPAGADDYITKPFDQTELRARSQVGERVVHLQQALANRLNELENALKQIKRLEGMLPICASCKSIRDHSGKWVELETYLRGHSDAEFSHGICPVCAEPLYPDIMQKIHQ